MIRFGGFSICTFHAHVHRPSDPLCVSTYRMIHVDGWAVSTVNSFRRGNSPREQLSEAVWEENGIGLEKVTCDSEKRLQMNHFGGIANSFGNPRVSVCDALCITFILSISCWIFSALQQFSLCLRVYVIGQSHYHRSESHILCARLSKFLDRAVFLSRLKTMKQFRFSVKVS